MVYVVFDVETTGLTKKDEVIQFSALVLDEKLAVHKLCNFYCYTQQAIDANAYNVHKIDKEILYKLSGGLTFEDNWPAMLDLVAGEKDVVWVDWSIGGFDQRLINQTLVNNGLNAYFTFPRINSMSSYPGGVCSYNLMKDVSTRFGKNSMSLRDAAKQLPITTEQIDGYYKRLMSQVGDKNRVKFGFHHSDYDALVTYLVMYNFVRR